MAEGLEDLPIRTLPEIDSDPVPVELDDDAATKEAAQLTRGKSGRDLEKEKTEREHDRDQAFRDVFESLSIYAMRFLFVVLVVIGTVWLLHMILPECYRWLTSDQVTILQNILTGGAIAGLLAEHFRHRTKH